MKSRWTLAIACFFAVVGSAYAQQPTKKVPKAPVTTPSAAVVSEPLKPEAPPPEQPFTPTPWRTDASVLAYKGNSPAQVFDWYEKQIAAVPGKPDKFSTSDEKKAYESALEALINSMDKIAMEAPCTKKYDADAQTYEIRISGFPIDDPNLSNPNPEQFRLRKVTLGLSELKRDSYIGQNAYGASTEIVRTVGDSYVVAFTADANRDPAKAWISAQASLVAPPYKLDYGAYVMKFNMLPAVARVQDEKIRCLAVFTVTMPGMFKFKERTFPTRDTPFDSTLNGRALAVTLDMVAAINMETAETYAKAVRNGSGL